MGKILHNVGTDIIIESENGKKFIIEEGFLNILEKNNNYTVDDVYNKDELYKNWISDYLGTFHSQITSIEYYDTDIKDTRKIDFKLKTAIGDNFYNLDEEFLKSLKVNTNYEVELLLVDEKNNTEFKFGDIILNIRKYDTGTIFTTIVEKTEAKGKVFFDKLDFIWWFSERYLGTKYNDGTFEKFTEIKTREEFDY